MGVVIWVMGVGGGGGVCQYASILGRLGYPPAGYSSKVTRKVTLRWCE